MASSDESNGRFTLDTVSIFREEDELQEEEVLVFTVELSGVVG